MYPDDSPTPVDSNGLDKFPALIHQTWKTNQLPEIFELWSSTWKLLHPNFEYKLWTDKDNLNFIEARYPEFLAEYLSYDQEIKRVDAIRYFYLYEFGGVYCDLDFECLKSLGPLLEQNQQHDVILGYMGDDRNFEQCIPNALMISKARSPFWLYVIAEMRKRINHKDPEYDTGPKLLKHCVDTYEKREAITVLHQDVFYGVNWAEKNGQEMRMRVIRDAKLFSPAEKKSLFPNAYAVTYWTHTW